MHGLPLTYNKDMQEDKEHLFDAVDTLELALDAATRDARAASRFDRERLAAAASDELIAATDVADLLVRRGVPFRQCHGIVAGLVRTAVESGRGARRDLTDEELHAAQPARSTTSSTTCSRSASWLESKVSEGGTVARRACASSSRRARALLSA